MLAAASLFGLEGLTSQCLVIMDETVNVETVVRYWEAASQYGCTDLVTTCQVRAASVLSLITEQLNVLTLCVCCRIGLQ